MSYSTKHRKAAAAPASAVAQRNGSAQIVDQRASTAAQLQLKQKADNRQRVGASRATAQMMKDEDEPLQAQFAGRGATQLAENEEVRPNNTGLPDGLKAGIENLSGMSMDHVKVHYNSAQPAQLNAHAYAQGSDIHLAPGQERQLPHEAWHVVQQAQGRVQPTVQLKKPGVAVNDDAGLEAEADLMGARALQPVGGEIHTMRQATNISFAQPFQLVNRAALRSVDRSPRVAARRAIVQGMFIGPPSSAVAMARQYIQIMHPQHAKEFDEIMDADTLRVDLNDWLADRLHIHINDIYDWEDHTGEVEGPPPPIDYSKVAGQSSLLPVEEKKNSPSAAASSSSSSSSTNKPATSLIFQAFEASGIPKKYLKNAGLCNLLLDIGAAELKAMDRDAKASKLGSFISEPLLYTSCHNTAVKLLQRMGDVSNGVGAYIGYDKENAATKTDGAWLNEVSSLLRTAIMGDIANGLRTIYEVHCGGHGFAVLVRDRKAEILQSFANAVFLMERMQRGPLVLAPDEVGTVVTALAASDQSSRDKAANVIAQCDAATFGLDPYPKFQYRFRSVRLQSDAELIEAFRSDLAAAWADVSKQVKAM